MKPIFDYSRRLAMVLGFFSVIGLSAVSMVFHLSQAKIKENQQAVFLHHLQTILPASYYDNDIAHDTLKVTDIRLGAMTETTVYRARYHNKPVAVVIESIAPEGYNGKIALLIAIKTTGELMGVKIIAHQETPGLGDKIDQNHSDWLLHFKGKSLDLPRLLDWAVKRDGGAFDQVTGATVTPRAVVKSVKNTLIYYQAHHAVLFK
jgi:Na+-translocating ferredoxin:NAD+ oxidoreductase subunit G